MENQQNQPAPGSHEFILNILWISLLGSVALLSYLAHEMSLRTDLKISENPPIQLFTILAVVVGGLSFILPTIIKPKAIKTTEGPSNLGPAQHYIGTVISLALSESVAIYGFILTNMTGNFQLYIPFGASAFLLMLIHGLRFKNKMRSEVKRIR